MDTKKYYAGDMGRALERIKDELGSDAIIVKSKKTKQGGIFGLFSKTVYEVTVSYDPADVKKRMTERARKKEDPFKTLLTEQKRRTEAESAALNIELEKKRQEQQPAVKQPVAKQPAAKQHAAKQQTAAKPKQPVLDIKQESFERVDSARTEDDEQERQEMLKMLLNDDTYSPMGTTPVSKLGAYRTTMTEAKPEETRQTPTTYGWMDAIQDAAMQSGEARAALLRERAQKLAMENGTASAKAEPVQTEPAKTETAQQSNVPAATPARAAQRTSAASAYAAYSGAYTPAPRSAAPAAMAASADSAPDETDMLNAVETEDTARQDASARQTVLVDAAPKGAQPQKRKRGRPRKYPLPQTNQAFLDESFDEDDDELEARAMTRAKPDGAWSNEMDSRIRSLEKMIESLPEKIQPQQTVEAGEKDEELDETMEAMRARLVEQDVAPEVISGLISDAQSLCARSGIDSRTAMEQVISELLGKAKQIRKTKKGVKTVLFVGPTGVGKTTTLVKLVSGSVVDRKSDVGIINADVYRIGAKEQISRYADILEVPIKTIYKVDDIKSAIAEFADKDFVFIDTCGKATMDREYQRDVRRLIELGDIQDVFVVVSSTSSHKVLKLIADSYAYVPRYSIILTKLDESQSFGAPLNMRYFDKHPLSYLTTGQTVPNDIMKADADEIISRLLG